MCVYISIWAFREIPYERGTECPVSSSLFMQEKNSETHTLTRSEYSH